MQAELEDLQPKLKVAIKETNKLMAVLEVQGADADEKKAVVAVEEKACNEKKENVNLSLPVCF